MSETLQNGEPMRLTLELIEARTGLKCYCIYPDFGLSGRVSPDLHEERERLAAELGEDNVLPSLFMDEEGVVQLGLFTKEPQKRQNADIGVGHEGPPIDFMSEDFDR